MIPTKKTSYVLAILFLSYSFVASAEDKTTAEEATWYSIEYIIFENNPLSNQPLEPWTNTPFQMPTDAIELDNLSEKKTFSPLKINQQQLHGVYKRLEKLSSYTPIAHGGWIQPLKQKEKLNAIQIIHQADSLQLEGTITFHRGRFLHLDVDLQLSEMIPLSVNDNYFTNSVIQPATLYRLQQTRRVKTSDSHYFDHPRFGVLAIVEKIDSPVKLISTTELIEEKEDIKAMQLKEPNSAILPNKTKPNKPL